MAKIEDIEREHKNKWLVVNITKENKLHEPVEGDIIFETDERHEAWNFAKKFTKTKTDLAIFFAGPPLKEGYAACF